QGTGGVLLVRAPVGAVVGGRENSPLRVDEELSSLAVAPGVGEVAKRLQVLLVPVFARVGAMQEESVLSGGVEVVVVSPDGEDRLRLLAFGEPLLAPGRATVVTLAEHGAQRFIDIFVVGDGGDIEIVFGADPEASGAGARVAAGV